MEVRQNEIQSAGGDASLQYKSNSVRGRGRMENLKLGTREVREFENCRT